MRRAFALTHRNQAVIPAFAGMTRRMDGSVCLDRISRMRTLVLLTLALLVGCGGARAQDRLVPYTVADGGIATPLTDQPGDPARGRAIVFDRQRGACLNCHAVPGARSPGTLAPDLAGVAARHPIAALRLRLVDPRRIDPESRMPAFYRVDGLVRVARAVAGKPLLQPQDIEDVLAYLATLE
jgi:sulfur-oxidizing protein SoxX